ncbi:hypothetical protein [Mycoplasmopsis alligatoris]|uniref:Uncharacterized protein n=1 Tax=Mycoplasmopsis alligatoris A21JP2 TaxID=747682 RepID=D4XVK2_9BACT|nr:hypothetical protein [Mycoplasmopsis alligatoris]EFF41580.1 hypothetical protein MALL_0577 [Mycoplasmopsis alligatoris A21JP2]
MLEKLKTKDSIIKSPISKKINVIYVYWIDDNKHEGCLKIGKTSLKYFKGIENLKLIMKY